MKGLINSGSESKSRWGESPREPKSESRRDDREPVNESGDDKNDRLGN